MTIRRPTFSDTDAHDSAAGLLAAAADLGVDAEEIRTITTGRRVAFEVPDEVYDEWTGAGAEPDPRPAITLHLHATYLGEDDMGGGDLGWSVDAAAVADGPARDVLVTLPGASGQLQVTLQTGADELTVTHYGAATIHTHSPLVQLIDAETGDSTQDTWSWADATADGPPFTLTLPAVP